MKKILILISFAILFLSSFNTKSAFSYQETKMDKQKLFKVVKVVDGDTITVNIRGKNESVRLLGIDTPETVDPRKPVQCFGKAASDKMKTLVLGKYVKLVDDKTQGNRDKYNRLLRFIYLPDSVATFVNGEMVKQGYAFSYKQYPTKFLDKFNNFEKYARENNLGLWGSCNLTPTPSVVKKVIVPTKTIYTSPIKTYTPPVQNTVAPVQKTENGAYACDCSKTCTQISSCAEAYYQLNNCGCLVRDNDGDGVPCESICR